MTTDKRTFETPVNVILITLTVIVYIIQLLISNGQVSNSNVLVFLGAKYGPLIEQGQYWRLFTPIFLHASLMHIGSNMLTLYFIGPIAERYFGSWRYLLIYLSSGIVGNVFSFVIAPNALSVGASTSIFGVFGALIMFGVVYWDNTILRSQTAMFIFFVVWNIITAFSQPDIDIWGHVGGLVGGFLLGFTLGIPRSEDRIKPMTHFVAALALVAIVFAMIYLKTA